MSRKAGYSYGSAAINSTHMQGIAGSKTTFLTHRVNSCCRVLLKLQLEGSGPLRLLCCK